MPDAALLGLVVDRIETHPPADGAADLILAAFQGAGCCRCGAPRRGRWCALTPVAQRGPQRPRRCTSPPSRSRASAASARRPRCPSIPDPASPWWSAATGRGSRRSRKRSRWSCSAPISAGSSASRCGVTDGRTCITAIPGWPRGSSSTDASSRSMSARVWKDGDGVDGSTLTVDGKPASAAALGWAPQLAGYPPLLSHNELEHALDREQSKLYDALAGILGLGDLATAQQVLQKARLSREHEAKDARDALPALRATPRPDHRRTGGRWCAPRCRRRRGISTPSRAPSAARRRATSAACLRKLRDLAGLPVLDRERLNAAITELRDAHAAAERLRGTDAGRAHEVASLLQQALDVHAHAEGERCPVCGTEGVLTYQWRVQARDQVVAAASRRRGGAQSARHARQRDAPGSAAGHRAARWRSATAPAPASTSRR